MVWTSKKSETVYALYRGDDFIDIGTKRQLAEKYGWSLNFVTFLSSQTNMKRGKGKRLLTIKIGKTTDNLKD